MSDINAYIDLAEKLASEKAVVFNVVDDPVRGMFVATDKKVIQMYSGPSDGMPNVVHRTR